MFETLSDRLSGIFETITGRGVLSEKDIGEALREVRRALLEADVALAVVKDFTDKVRERAVGAEVVKAVKPGQMVVKIVHDQLVEMLGAEAVAVDLNAPPPVALMMVGLQGSGKTTSSAKVARWIVRQGRQPLLVAADPYRPAAVEQLVVLGDSLDIPVYQAPDGTPVPRICTDAVKHARQTGRDVVILDTAGRLSVDEGLMAEIRDVAAAVEPTETLLVVDAMVGQEKAMMIG